MNVMTEQRCIYSGLNKCCAYVSHMQHTLITAVFFIKRSIFIVHWTFHFMAMVCHGLMGEFEVTKATVESSLIFGCSFLSSSCELIIGFFIYAQYWRLINSEH